MTPEAFEKALQNTASLPWRGAESTCHVLGRQGYEIGRFVDRASRDLAVAAVNGAPDLLTKCAGLELDLEAARVSLAGVLERASAATARAEKATSAWVDAEGRAEKAMADVALLRARVADLERSEYGT